MGLRKARVISHKYKCVFIHIPKCAGQSMEKALGKKNVKRWHRRVPHRVKHGRPNYVGNSKYWNNYFTFTFVRNPWDRVVSAFFFDKGFALNHMNGQKVVMNKRRHLIKNGLLSKMGDVELFRDVIKNKLEKYSKQKLRIYTPQIKWIDGFEYDFIGRVENIKDDWENVCSAIGEKLEIVHMNRSDRKEYNTYYDNNSKDLVYKIYKKEIKTFKYEF